MPRLIQRFPYKGEVAILTQKSGKQPAQPRRTTAYNRDASLRRDDKGRRSVVAQRRAKKNRKLAAILGAAVLLLAAVIAVWTLQEPSKVPSPKPSTPEPSSQPTQPSTQPTQPSTQPTEPSTQPVVGTDILAQYSSDNYGGDDRTVNLKLACAALDGTMVAAGEEFSFNGTVGERTPEKGYLPASIYADGNVVQEVGGGICQVASTLYLVALKADLEITERQCHQFPVNYLPLGMDAAIYWGSLDFCFRNTSGAPIRILASADENDVQITIEGTKSDSGYIRMDYEILETYEPEERIEVDEAQEPGYEEVRTTPVTGFLIQTYYCYYDADDNLLERTPCALSDYDKRDKVIVVGPEEPEPEPEPNFEDIPETEPPPTESSTQSDLPASEPSEVPEPSDQPEQSEPNP